VTSLSSVYDGTTRLYWSSYPTNGSVNPALTPDEIMARVTKGFSRNQLHGVTKVDAPDDISPACVQNFNGHSRCFASVTFNPPLVHEYTNQPNLNNTVGYLIQVDAALRHIDVRGQSDYERRMFPLQFALDQAITELSTNVTLPIPMEWQFTQETNEAEDNGIRLCMTLSFRSRLRAEPCQQSTSAWCNISSCCPCSLHMSASRTPFQVLSALSERRCLHRT
jgi:ATP-binding cassette subfamily A (ABC1) protein 3